MPNEIPIDPSNLIVAADQWVTREGFEDDEPLVLGEMDVAALHPDLLDPAVVRDEVEHQRRLDEIMNDKIRADDPQFEKRASDRRAAIAELNKSKAACGEDGGFVPPAPIVHDPAPQPSRGFIVEKRRRRGSI